MHRGNSKRVGCRARAPLAALVVAAMLVPARGAAGPALAGDEDGTSAADAPRTPVQNSTREKLRELSRELGKLAAEHGPDAVSLQVGLLTGTIRAGAVGPTEVEIVGPSPQAGPEYLRFRVLTGLIFDSATSTPGGRLDLIWNGIAAPAFEGMETFEMEPCGLELVFEYGLQALAEQPDGLPDPTAVFEARTVTLRITPATTQDYGAGAVTVAQLRAAATVVETGPVGQSAAPARAPGED